jgi:hypothetical protein
MATAFPSAEAQDRFGNIGFVMNGISAITLIIFITIPLNTVMLNVQSIGRIAQYSPNYSARYFARDRGW